jgi:hypothetical protein
MMLKRYGKWLVGTLTLLIVAAGYFFYTLGPFEGGTSKPLQQDFDRLRLDHILVIATLIQEYENITGHFPLADRGDGKAVAVVIASEEQLANDKGRVPILLDLRSRAVDGKAPDAPGRVERLTLQDLTKELENVLKRSIALPLDPQRFPVNKPSVYVYTCYLDVFDVSAFLHNSFPFARQLSEFNNKVAVGSRSNAASGIWTPDELIQVPEFKAFFQTPFNRRGATLQTKIQ